MEGRVGAEREKDPETVNAEKKEKRRGTNNDYHDEREGQRRQG